jgi:hypothetical protein
MREKSVILREKSVILRDTSVMMRNISVIVRDVVRDISVIVRDAMRDTSVIMSETGVKIVEIEESETTAASTTDCLLVTGWVLMYIDAIFSNCSFVQREAKKMCPQTGLVVATFATTGAGTDTGVIEEPQRVFGPGPEGTVVVGLGQKCC